MWTLGKGGYNLYIPSKGRGRIAPSLLHQTSGGMQKLNCSNTEGLFRTIRGLTLLPL